MRLLQDVYKLITPYGRKKLLIVAVTIIIQGVVQTLGVTSIMPFLAIAANPAAARESGLGRWTLGYLPEMTDQTLLIVAGLLSIAALMTTNVVALFTVYVTQRYVRGLSQWLRSQLIWQIATRDYAYFLQHSTAVMMKKVNGDARGVVGQVLQPLLQLVSGSVNMALLAIALLWVDPIVAIVATLVFSIAYAVIFGALSKFRRQFSSGMKEITRETNRKAQQLFGGIKPIKVQGVERPFLKEFDAYALREAKLQAAQQIFLVAPKQIIEPIVFGTLVLVVLLSAGRGESLTSLIPTLGLMTMAAYRLLPNFQNMYVAAMVIGSNSHVLEEVLIEFDVDSANDHQRKQRQTTIAKPMHWKTQIQLVDVTFAYPSSPCPVIDSLNLTIPKNSSAAIVGTTGCGKSTLVDMILGLHFASSGKIWIDDVVLSPANERAWRSGVGYVPQEIFLLDDTIRANVALGVAPDEIDQDRLRHVCEAAQILHFIERELPQDWDTQVGERGVRLSGGQRQRIGLARALYRQPELLILDEATSALDTATESAVMDSIKDIKGELTMLIVAHRTSTIQWCDQIVNLSGAEIASS